MGTVTSAHDGSVSEQPASEGLRGILETEMKGSNPTMSSARTISGGDDRTQITDTSAYPAIAVGWLIGHRTKQGQLVDLAPAR